MTTFNGHEPRRVESRVSHVAALARADTRRADTKAQILLAVIGVALIAGMPGLLRDGLGRMTLVAGWCAVIFASFALFALVLVVLPRPGKAPNPTADDLIAHAVRDLDCSGEYVREQAEQAAVIRRLAALKWHVLGTATYFTLAAGLVAAVSFVAAAVGA